MSVFDMRERPQLMRLRPLAGHDVFDRNAARHQCVGDHRAMAAPPHSFRTHDCHRFLRGKLMTIGLVRFSGIADMPFLIEAMQQQVKIQHPGVWLPEVHQFFEFGAFQII